MIASSSVSFDRNRLTPNRGLFRGAGQSPYRPPCLKVRGQSVYKSRGTSKAANEDLETLAPLIAHSIVSDKKFSAKVNRKKLKDLGVLMNKSDCQILIDSITSQPDFSSQVHRMHIDLTQLRNNHGRYEATFNQLAAHLFGRTLTSKYFKRNRPQMIKDLVLMYTRDGERN